MRLTALVAVAALELSCRSVPVQDVTTLLPRGASIVAGVHLKTLRSSPLWQQLPPNAAAVLAPLHEAEAIWFGSDGSDYLILTRGTFAQAPAGGTLLAPGVAAIGSADWMHFAQPSTAAPSPLLRHAQSITTRDIWIAALGTAPLPLSGNGRNLTQLLRATEYTTLAVTLGGTVSIEVVGTCSGPESAQRLEETLRAMITLGAAASGRRSPLEGLLRRIQLTRTDRVVSLRLSALPSELQPLFALVQ